jgi:hypothetical protein
MYGLKLYCLECKLIQEGLSVYESEFLGKSILRITVDNERVHIQSDNSTTRNISLWSLSLYIPDVSFTRNIFMI